MGSSPAVTVAALGSMGFANVLPAAAAITGYNVLVKPGVESRKAAADAADKQQKQVNAQIAAQQAQKVNAQNQSANATASAQARVRALVNPNPSGGTLMTPPPSVGSVSPTTGKTFLGS